jgi:hypothetical protein
MEKEYFRTFTEYIEFDPNTNVVTTISNNPDIGCFYYSSFKHRGTLEFEGALYQAKIAAKLTQRLDELAQTDTTTRLTATDDYGRTIEYNPYQMARRQDFVSTASEFNNTLAEVKALIANS